MSFFKKKEGKKEKGKGYHRILLFTTDSVRVARVIRYIVEYMCVCVRVCVRGCVCVERGR